MSYLRFLCGDSEKSLKGSLWRITTNKPENELMKISLKIFGINSVECSGYQVFRLPKTQWIYLLVYPVPYEPGHGPANNRDFVHNPILLPKNCGLQIYKHHHLRDGILLEETGPDSFRKRFWECPERFVYRTVRCYVPGLEGINQRFR